MTNRRNFIKKATIGSLGMTTINSWSSALITDQATTAVTKLKKPLIISTWSHGFAANEEALRQLEKGKSAIDAIVSGVGVCEADPDNRSVGYGGLPDREGHVTLDACIMNAKSN